MISFSIKNRWSGEIQFTAKIDCKEDAHVSLKVGMAVKWGIENKADLQSADLQSANLQSADLQSANLRYADLQSADLQSANLQYANLRSANLQSADLQSANLQSANLQYADLQYADLQSTDLQYANLQYADLQYAKNSELAIARTVIVPSGEIDGWKKCRGEVLVELRVPRESKRSNANGRKCRADFVDVVKVHHESGVGISIHDQSVIYREGQRVSCSEWCDDRWQECAGGIHFYLTKEEAEAHS